MKRALLAILLSLTLASWAQAGDYLDGWKCGWKAGWQQVNGQYSYAPYAPYPPYPPFGGDDYRTGFAAGVLTGCKACICPKVCFSMALPDAAKRRSQKP